MTDNFQKMQAELVATYEKWWEEVCQLGFDADKYSNPFYCGIPSNWAESDIRIMICGEEGYGYWNKELKPTDIVELQKHNLEYINGKRVQGNIYTNKSSQFWIRVKQIEFLQHDIKILETMYKVSTNPIIWNDCDKICNGSGTKNGKLSAKERTLLHSVNTKLLRREIEITKPTHIVFLGWYIKSLTENTLYFYSKPQTIENGYNFPLNIQTAKIGDNAVKLYYLYHPSLWKNRDKYNKDIEQIIQDIKTDKEMISKGKAHE